MGRQPRRILKMQSENREMNLLQDHLAQQLAPITDNALFSVTDFRWNEGAYPSATSPLALLLQYRTPGTETWTTIAAFNSSGQLSTVPQAATGSSSTVAQFLSGVFTAKGSLIAASGPGVGVEQLAGVDGTVPVYDSTQPTGIRAGNIVSAGGVWSLAAKPRVADPRDCEFEGTPYAGWSTSGVIDPTAIDPYWGGTTSNQWRASWDSLRPSWLMIQHASDAGATNGGVFKPVVLGTNEFFWGRLAGSRRNASSAIGEGAVRIGLHDFNYPNNPVDAIFIMNRNLTTTTPAVLVQWTKSSVTTNTNFLYAGWAGEIAFEYFAIHKTGTTFSAWIAPSNGCWLYLTQVTGLTGSLVRVLADTFQVANVALPGNAIVGFDFIRFKASATDMP